ncbi:unnamed protein product [marine sediment metagenome]|uniref:Uncharacterized protein n=1 Tax=marine sediment metagenome TaxID=412755 RepID=X0Y2X6_9ZZZZ
MARFGTIRFSSNCEGVDLSPDGRLIASADNWRGISLWDARSGKLISRMVPKAHPEDDPLAVVCAARVAFSPDGRTLASCGSPMVGGDHISLWDVKTSSLKGELGADAGVAYDVAWSPDGRRIAGVRPDGSTLIWNAATGERQSEFKQPEGPRSVWSSRRTASNWPSV